MGATVGIAEKDQPNLCLFIQYDKNISNTRRSPLGDLLLQEMMWQITQFLKLTQNQRQNRQKSVLNFYCLTLTLSPFVNNLQHAQSNCRYWAEMSPPYTAHAQSDSYSICMKIKHTIDLSLQCKGIRSAIEPVRLN